MLDIIITIIYIVHLQILALHYQLSRIQAYNPGSFSLFPAALSWVPLLLPWVCIAGWVPGGFEAMMHPTPTEQRTSVPMPPPPSNSCPHNTGDALETEAMNTCEDDALCEMVKMTWVMRESNCSKQRNQQWGPRIYGPDLSPAPNQSQLENWVVIITKSQNDRFSHEASKAP